MIKLEAGWDDIVPINVKPHYLLGIDGDLCILCWNPLPHK